ncbi:MAG: hypothetical protein PHX70_09775 [Clostridium sp.]|nr:hypothetical protein [Clostridium sp.]
MKKLIVVTLITMLIFSGCAIKSSSSDKNTVSDINTINSLAIITLPSPPKEKIITKRKDIIAVINLINSFKKTKIHNQNTAGWVIFIKTSGKENHSITFSGGKVVIDNTSYRIDNSDITNVKNLYNKLNYKEKPYLTPQ